MSATRTIRDFIYDGFFARDKATVAAVVKDAEAAIPPVVPVAPVAPVAPDNGHVEPDGDEGDTTKHGGVHVHIEHKGDGAASLDARVATLEDSLKAIDAKVTKVVDAITAAKDGDLPPWLKKGDKEDEPTGDAIEAPHGELGAQTAEKLGSAEPELMEADPALKTGPSQMGDAVYVDRITKGVRRLIKDVRARAEILSPGIQFATVDGVASTATADALCSMRRGALRGAATTSGGQKALGRFSVDAIETMSCAMVRTLFLDASDRMKELNNAPAGQYHALDEVFAAHDAQRDRLKKINEANSAFWNKQSGAVRVN